MALEDVAVTQWNCLCPPERRAMSDLAIASLSLGGFVLKTFITAHFEAYSPMWFELRRDTWVAAWNVTETTITIGETEHEVYLADQSWMTALSECILATDCPECPNPGLAIAGYSPPVDLDFC